ncbi:hypothetical protein AGMMS49965_10510 [Bacteroidia bacterium]|nr:hypothetical protein AGMMS49965_10510 [Bacteroidia bacterium]
MKKVFISMALFASVMLTMTNIVNAQVPQKGNKQTIGNKARAAAAATKQEAAKQAAKREAAEREAAEKARQKRLSVDDRSAIESCIKENLTRWSKKGEFERQNDYEQRLRTQSESEFINICKESVAKCNSLDSRYGGNCLNIGQYDSEKELFPISVDFPYSGLETMQFQLKIPFENAEEFKEKFKSRYRYLYPESWCFVKNTIFPNRIEIKFDNRKYTLDMPIENQSEIIFSFDDLGIDNPYLKGFVCNLGNANALIYVGPKG